MGIKDFNSLIKSLSSNATKKVVVAAAHDHHALEAVLNATADGIVNYLLVGRSQDIIAIGKELGTDINPANIIHADTDEDSAFRAVEQIRLGNGDFLMKGAIGTGTLLSAVLNRETGIRTDKLMNHFSLLEIPAYHKLLALTDAGMIIQPDLGTKKDMIMNSVDFLQRLGCEQPKVAVMTAVENVTDKMPETEDAAALKKMGAEGAFGDCIVEGPISFDLAISTESAEIKGYKSPVTGSPDLMLVPNIASGNLLAKGLLYMANARMAGCILGAKVPIVLTSRGATADEKLLSIVICAASCK